MKLIIAPDSYKDALPAGQAAQAIAEGLRRALPQADLVICPMGDGGEGSLDALLEATGAELRRHVVQDALGRPTLASWGWNPSDQIAYVELAEASGLQALAAQERSALHTSTYGVGELIRVALDVGAQRLLLLLGGSATNDAGAGMLTALGARLLDEEGTPLSPGGGDLERFHTLEFSGLDPRLRQLQVQVAVDVDNPLTGPRGASAVFGPQKGASDGDVARLDAGLATFAGHVNQALGQDYRQTPGAGAAGGVGFAALALLQAELRPGIELIMEHVRFEELLKSSDLVITGEGRLDAQSLAGKTPVGIARAAKRFEIPVVVLAGSLDQGWQETYAEGVTAAFTLTDRLMKLEQALPRCAELLADRAESIGRLIQVKLTNLVESQRVDK